MEIIQVLVTLTVMSYMTCSYKFLLQVVPPVRCKKKLQTSASDVPKKISSSGESKRKKNEGEEKSEKERIKSYDYAAWDKFDVVNIIHYCQ